MVDNIKNVNVMTSNPNINVKFTENFGPSLNPMIQDETKILQNISICYKLESEWTESF